MQDSGQGRSSGQGNSSNAGGASGKGNSASEGSQGKSSNQGTGDAPDKSRGPKSAQPPGLSGILGTITNSLRPVATAPVSILERVIAPRSNPKSKSTARSAPSARSKEDTSRQAAQRSKADVGGKIAAGISARAPVTALSPPSPTQLKSASEDPTLAKPMQAARSIVATGLSSDGLARLTRKGFRAQMQTKGSLASVVRLLPPRGMSLAQAQRAVRLADAGAAADFDHFYYTDEGSSCIGATCEAASLIGWNLSTASQCGPVPMIGLIDTGIDPEHEALQGQSIEIVSGLHLQRHAVAAGSWHGNRGSSRRPKQKQHSGAPARSAPPGGGCLLSRQRNSGSNRCNDAGHGSGGFGGQERAGREHEPVRPTQRSAQESHCICTGERHRHCGGRREQRGWRRAILSCSLPWGNRRHSRGPESGCLPSRDAG